MPLTFTSTTFANLQPKGPHVGLINVSGVVTVPTSGQASTQGSAGDVVFLCKIPHGAVIVDFEEDHTSVETAHSISFGLAKGGPAGSATLSILVASGAKATLNRRAVLNNSGGITVSVSDNDPDRFGILGAKLGEAGSATTTTSIAWSVTYKYDRVGG